MAILNIFKKQEKEEPKKKPQKKVKKAKTVSSKKVLDSVESKKKPAVAKKTAPAPQKQKKVSEIGHRVLIRPQITEKATDQLKYNQYVFRVFPRANKIEIRNSIEGAYGVDVESVQIVNVPAKKKRLGKIQGWQKGYKKAIVKIKNGQKIDILPR